MKLAISNLAWEPAHEPEAAELMASRGVRGVEIAATRRWPDPLLASDAELAEYRRNWAARGIEVVSLQALLYGRSDLVLFGSAEARRATVEYLVGLLRVAKGLGASVLVFGAAAQRRRGTLPLAEAQTIARDVFAELGAAAARQGAAFCLEALPALLGCDFITDTTQALALVEDVASPGFALNFDTACLRLAGEDFSARYEVCRDAVRHVHLSEPELLPLGPDGTLDPQAIARVLVSGGYDGWTSIEMRTAPLAVVKRALDFVSGALVP